MSKKNKSITDPVADLRKKDRPLHPKPKSAQECIDIVAAAENGIFELPDKRFSATWKIKDINYKLENEDDRDEILYKYATKIINPIRDPFKITLINRKKDIQTMEAEYLYPEKSDGYEELRSYVNAAILDKIKKSRKGYEQEKYITITTTAEQNEDVELKFKGINDDLVKGFHEIDSNVTRINGDERLALIRTITEPDATCDMPEISSLISKNRSYLDEIVGMSGFDFSDKKRESFRIGKKYCMAMNCVSYPEVISDEFMDRLMNYPAESIISLDFVPVPPAQANKFVNGIYRDVEEKIRKQQNIRNKNRDYSSDISEKVKSEKEDITEYMKQSRQSCEKMYLGGIIIIIRADTKSELLSAANGIKTIGEKYQVGIETSWMFQKESFTTALPIGNRHVENLRMMFSSDIASLCPFQTSTLDIKGRGICYGSNQLSEEPIIGNRKSLTFGGGFYLGKPGSGKSFDGKWEMANILVGTNDSIIVIDPTLEYGRQELINVFNGSYLDFAPGSHNHLNPLNCQLEIYDSPNFKEFIDETSNYMLSVFSQMMPGEIESSHNTIISRSVQQMYEKIRQLPKKERYVPIMSDLKEVLDEQPEPQAIDLSLALELYTTGTFSMFNHLTDVNVDNRYMAFGIKNVGKKLFGQAMLAINRYIDEKVTANWEKGITTHVYYDEVHEILKDPASADTLDNSWRKHRKMNAIDTGLTHTIEEIIKNDIAEAMVKNSEFLMILKSSKASGGAILSSVEGMKPEYLKYVINAPVAHGLLKHGADIIPFNGLIEESNPLVKIFNTDPKKFTAEE
ncbi:MAG: hypothetical protein K2M78_08055 [Lachnospiraceae bacterium]|nr:hypothetical protein [Lachnospiraceae bacterium]